VKTDIYNEYEGIARDNGEETCSSIDTANSGNINLMKWETEKILKYEDCTIEIKPTRNL